MANSWRIGRDGGWETERGLRLSPFSPDRYVKRIRSGYEMQSDNVSQSQNSCVACEMCPGARQDDLIRHHVDVIYESTSVHVDQRGRDQVRQPYDHYHLNGQSSDAEVLLPPKSTLFIEGVPVGCTRREASYIFRPFIGFKDLRLVTRHSKNPSRGLVTLCFVDFMSPAQAAVAMNYCQGK